MTEYKLSEVEAAPVSIKIGYTRNLELTRRRKGQNGATIQLTYGHIKPIRAKVEVDSKGFAQLVSFEDHKGEKLPIDVELKIRTKLYHAIWDKRTSVRSQGNFIPNLIPTDHLLTQAMDAIHPVVNHEIQIQDHKVTIHDYRLDPDNPSVAFAIEHPHGRNNLRMVVQLPMEKGKPVQNKLTTYIYEHAPSGDVIQEGHLTKDQFNASKHYALEAIEGEIERGNNHPHLPVLRDMISDHMHYATPQPKLVRRETRLIKPPK